MNDIRKELKQTEAFEINKTSVEQAASFLVRLLGITLILLLISGGWYLAAKNSAERTADRIKDVDDELDSYKTLETEMIAFQGAVKNIDSALNNKKDYKPIFNELAKVVPKEVQISKFSIDSSSKVKIDGTAPNLTSMARVLVAFANNKVFQGLQMTSFSYSAGKITFSLGATAATTAKKEEK